MPWLQLHQLPAAVLAAACAGLGWGAHRGLLCGRCAAAACGGGGVLTRGQVQAADSVRRRGTPAAR